MLFIHDYVQTMAIVLSYTIIYNVTSFLFFGTIIQVPSTGAKTLYSLASLGSGSFYSKVLVVCILSLAGVPPFVGFFAKVYALVLLAVSNLVVLFPPFSVLLFMGLYFYVQNLRFLNSTNPPSSPQLAELSSRPSTFYYAYALPITFFTIFGFCYVDDLLLMSS
jgi:NADH:ubiquinone oxidoreductase subunit 2 (subunit N)